MHLFSKVDAAIAVTYFVERNEYLWRELEAMRLDAMAALLRYMTGNETPQ